MNLYGGEGAKMPTQGYAPHTALNLIRGVFKNFCIRLLTSGQKCFDCVLEFTGFFRVQPVASACYYCKFSIGE